MLAQLNNVSKFYGKHKALKNINLSLKKGKVYGLIGVNGSGKSTLIKLLTGSHYPTEGEVLLLGHDMTWSSKKALAKIGYLPENSPLYPEMTVIEYLIFIGKMKGLSNEPLNKSLKEVLSAFDLKNSNHKIIATLSHGFSQRVGLAGAFLGKPSFIILDEPTNGLDPHQVVALREYIKKRKDKTSFLFSSHVLSEIENICDTLIILDKGEIKALGHPQEIASKGKKSLCFEIILEIPPEKIQEKKAPFVLLEKKEDLYLTLLIELKEQKTEVDLLLWIKENNLILKSLIPQSLKVENLFNQIIQKE